MDIIGYYGGICSRMRDYGGIDFKEDVMMVQDTRGRFDGTEYKRTL